MSVKTKGFYWVECDACGKNAQELSDYSSWGEPGHAVDVAVSDAEFVEVTDGDRAVHLCPSHKLDLAACPSCCEDLEESATSLTEDEVIQHCPHCHHITTIPLEEQP
jgi:hypothetical protein